MEEKIYELACSPFTPYQVKKIILFPVSTQIINMVRRATGINISGYYHQIDNYSLRHAFGKHSLDKIPLTIEDFRKIPIILKNPNIVNMSGKTKQKLLAIQYIKTCSKHTYHYIEEIRVSKNILHMKTMYIDQRTQTKKKPFQVRPMSLKK